MKTRIALILVGTWALSVASLGQAPGQDQAEGQSQAKTGERLLYLRWEKWAMQQDEMAKRCLLVETTGHYRFERATEAIGGGGGEKAYEGQLSPEDLAALKALITSSDFNHMKVPQANNTGDRTIHNEREIVDYSSPEDELPPISIDSVDGDMAIPKQLRQLSDWVKKIEKMKPQQVKGPMQICGKTQRFIITGDEDHRIDNPPKKK